MWPVPYDVWCMAYGAWCMAYGIWAMAYGRVPWRMYDLLRMVYGLWPYGLTALRHCGVMALCYGPLTSRVGKTIDCPFLYLCM